MKLTLTAEWIKDSEIRDAAYPTAERLLIAGYELYIFEESYTTWRWSVSLDADKVNELTHGRTSGRIDAISAAEDWLTTHLTPTGELVR